MKIALHPNGGEKLTEIISIFLKDAGFANLEYPGNFNEFSMWRRYFTVLGHCL